MDSAYGTSLVADKSGPYVFHADYAALEARMARLEECLREVMHSGSELSAWVEQWPEKEGKRWDKAREAAISLLSDQKGAVTT
jgi:hypothetical protein